MTMLTADQSNFYQQNGYLAPINIFTDEEAKRNFIKTSSGRKMSTVKV